MSFSYLQYVNHVLAHLTIGPWELVAMLSFLVASIVLLSILKNVLEGF